MDIHLLFKQLGSIRAVAKHTGYSRNTVRGLLRSNAPPVFDKPARKTGVDDFKDYLTRRFTEHGLSAERLLAEIRAQVASVMVTEALIDVPRHPYKN